MALSITWGLAFSTILILLLIPCFSAAVDDLKRATQWLVGPGPARGAPARDG